MSNEINDNQGNDLDFTRLEPWNSREYPIVVNSIRYNQDFSLLTLGTSKGYRIFLTSTLRLAHDPTDEVKNLGNIGIAMSYYKSSLVFLLPSKSNRDYPNNELIVFDDFYQTKFASFKDKSEAILNFFISKNCIFIIALSKIIILEIFSFNIIDVINNINSIKQLLSFNFYNFIAYTELKDKKKIYVNFYINENNRIKTSVKKEIVYNFNYMQTFQLSPTGHILAIVSVYGNKMHLYYTQNGKLKECILLSPYIQTIEKVLFSEKKSNYLFVLRNDNKFNIYKIENRNIDKPKCICDKYDDNKITKKNKEENNSGLIGYFRKYSKNKDVKEILAYSDFEGITLFIDFDRNKNKDIIIINEKGQFIKYHFKKKVCGRINPILSIQWE